MRFFALLAAALGACAPKPAPSTSAEHAFHLEPLTDLVAAPHLTWLVDAEPRVVYALPGLAVALEEVVDSARLAAFTRAHGGLDPRGLRELVYARFEPDGALWAGRGFVPSAVEGAELANVPYVRQHAREPSGLVRIEGRSANEATEILLFGHQGAALAQRAPFAAQVARAFAEERLKKTRPALRASPLAEVVAALGPAPLRVFGARPDVTFARDGLFEHFEAVALSASAAEDRGATWLVLRLAGLGSFGGRTEAVESALRERLERVTSSRFGALLGLDPAEPWRVRVDARVARAERRVQAAPFLHGLHLALRADTAELFGPR